MKTSPAERPQTNKSQVYVFEGAHNCGKTTLSQIFAERLATVSPLPVIWRSFPGRLEGTLGAMIYDLHHRPTHYVSRIPTPLSIQALHIAAHIDNIEADLLPAVRANTTVVLDRCWWSTWVHGIDTGCLRDQLDSFIDIERAIWQHTKFTIFLIKRHQAKTQQIVELYERYAGIDTGNITVEHIDNNGSLNDTLDHIFSLI